MKRRYICLSLVLAATMTCSPVRAVALTAEEQSPLLISEVRPGTTASASQEFIQLYNASSESINLSAGKWRLEIASSTAANWDAPYRTIELSGTIEPAQAYIITSKYTSNNQLVQYLPELASASFSAGISASAGHIRLVSVTKQLGATGACADTMAVLDEVEWSGLTAAGTPGSASPDGRSMYIVQPGGIDPAFSLQRLVSRTLQLYADTNDDSKDFTLSIPAPGSPPILKRKVFTMPHDTCSVPVLPDPSDVLPEPPSPPADTGSGGDGGLATTPDDSDGTDDPVLIPDANGGLLPISITELLPNPASPQTDSADEFIELYNPNDDSFDVSGFVLEVGLTTKHRYVFPDGTTLASKTWNPMSSAVTGLSMANDGGQARLLDPLGVVIAVTEPYGSAPDGQAWAYDGLAWRWTTTPTPASQNVVTAPAAITKKPAATATASKKAPAVKAASAPKATKKAAEKAPKAPKTTKTATPLTPVAAAVRNPMHIGVLAAIGVFAISYGAYEYRSDIANKFYQLRGHGAARRGSGSGVARRRDH